MITEALEYLKLGWSLIPLEREGKHPHSLLLRDTEEMPYSWEVYRVDKAAAPTVEYWFRTDPQANLGVVTGAISGLLVVDIDTKDQERVDRLRGLLPDGIKMPIVRTHRGYHWYFRHPGGEMRLSNGSRRAEVVDWLHIRGDGGYVVLPPSIHPEGDRYQWSFAVGYGSLDPLSELPEMPKALFDYLFDPAKGPQEAENDDPYCQNCPDDDYDDYDDDDDEFEDDFDEDDDDGFYMPPTPTVTVGSRIMLANYYTLDSGECRALAAELLQAADAFDKAPKEERF